MTNTLSEKLDLVFGSVETQYNHENSVVSFKSNSGANDDQIHKLQEQLQISLPEEYIAFVKRTNGCEMYNYRDLDGFLFFDTKAMIDENIGVDEVYDTLRKNIIVFCAILGEGNFLGFKIQSATEYTILDCFHEDDADSWKTIPGSFDSFMEKLIDLKGEKFWL